MEIDHSPEPLFITGLLFTSLSLPLDWVGISNQQASRTEVTNLMEIHLEGNMTNQIVFFMFRQFPPPQKKADSTT